MEKFAAMGKTELRAACKAARISYGALTVGGMRDALAAHAAAQEPVYKVADPATMTPDEIHNSLCPHCGIHLSNGLLSCDDEAMSKGTGGLSISTSRTMRETGDMKTEWECMGCGAGFGAAVQPPAKQDDRHTGTGLKIEKVREERNGVKRPSAGGKCRAIWDALDAYVADPDNEGTMPTAKIVKDIAVAEGWNPANASIEFYNWRKFNGITGRAK